MTWDSSFSVISFCLFILFMGLSRQEYLRGLPFSSPVNHILSKLSTMTCPSWVALHSMTRGFIELDKDVVHVISLVSFLWLWFSLCLPSDEEGSGAYGSFLMGETDWGKPDLVLTGRTMLSKSLIQFSVYWWGCIPSLLFDLRLNNGGRNEWWAPSKDLSTHCCVPCPRPKVII